MSNVPPITPLAEVDEFRGSWPRSSSSLQATPPDRSFTPPQQSCGARSTSTFQSRCASTTSAMSVGGSLSAMGIW